MLIEKADMLDALLGNFAGMDLMTDAVEIVRCGDCKHFNFDDQAAQDADWSGRCRYGGRRMDVDDCCSRGERRDDD